MLLWGGACCGLLYKTWTYWATKIFLVGPSASRDVPVQRLGILRRSTRVQLEVESRIQLQRQSQLRNLHKASRHAQATATAIISIDSH